MNDDFSVQYRIYTTHRETYDYSYGIHSYSLRFTFHMLFSLKCLSGRTQLVFTYSEILLLPKMNTYKQLKLLKSSTWAQVLRQQSAILWHMQRKLCYTNGIFSCQRVNTLDWVIIWALISLFCIWCSGFKSMCLHLPWLQDRFLSMYYLIYSGNFGETSIFHQKKKAKL